MITLDLYMRCLYDIGFLCAGVGAIGFFFINAFVIGSVVGCWAINPIYGEHTFRIRGWWLKDKEGNVEEYAEYLIKEDGRLDTSNWSKRKIFAFRSVDEGPEFCFMLVCIGFMIQFMTRCWELFYS